jgi:flavin-dependent dehydrogenase
MPATAAPLDAAILGGGPAGAAAAALLARWGLRVAVIARPAPGPALVESLPPSCVRLFDRLGLRTAMDHAGFIRATGNTVHWGGAAARVEPFAAGQFGYQVPRDRFDAVMLSHAERLGARIVRDATVLDVASPATASNDSASRDGETSIVRYEVAGRAEEVAAHWVLDCTGRSGILAKRGWRRAESGQRTMALVGAWDRADGWTGETASHTVVESYDDGWGWSVPVSATRRLVTIMVDPERTRLGGKSQLADVYADELARLRALPELVVGAERSGAERSGAELRGGSDNSGVWARDASSYSAERAAARGVMLVGDAASFVDPLSSFGVKKALASAWLAAVVVRSVREDATMMDHAIELFARREREISGALKRRLAQLARDAAGGHAPGFWDSREVEDVVNEQPSEPDVAALRDDPVVKGAFEQIRAKEAVRFSVGGAFERRSRATVVEDRVALGEQLILPGFPGGIRHLRQVDLLRLAELAPEFEQVGDLYEAYAKRVGPAPLPDFLGALSVLVAQKALVLD